jgi:hypothetical protein
MNPSSAETCPALARGPCSDRIDVPLVMNLLVIHRLFAMSKAPLLALDMSQRMNG